MMKPNKQLICLILIYLLFVLLPSLVWLITWVLREASKGFFQ